MTALGLAAESCDQTLDAFLGNVDVIIHGTTVATNAVVEGKTARIGFITTAGHPDVLTLREASQKGSFDWHIDYPEPFVPPNLTREVSGRLDSTGRELTPLRDADVYDAIAHFRAMEVEAIGVCLLWSIVNGAHERRVAALIRSKWPEIPVTLSHDLNPILREYRRAISTVIDASLYPVVSHYVERLDKRLRGAGYSHELLIANCSGGMMLAEQVLGRPIYVVMSGPTLAPVAAQHLTDEANVIVINMGGTTLDVSAIRDRRLVVSPEAMLTDYDMLGLPKVDVRSIGAGGGSIAWVDDGGLLRVGPQIAGAHPGPACYGTGGTAPTVTDANVVLGMLDPNYFLGGRIVLESVAAERAVSAIVDQLGTGLVETAYAIHATSNHNMIAAIEDITIREGIDPRESYLVAGGAATVCHICEMSDILGIGRFMIPRLAAGLSALGGLVSDFRIEVSGALTMTQHSFDSAAVNALLATLVESGDAFLRRAGVAQEDRRFEYFFAARYRFQSWEIGVPVVPGADGLATTDLPRLVNDFHAMHERIYTIKNPGESVEFTSWTVRAIGANPRARAHADNIREPATIKAEPKGTRPIYLPADGAMIGVPVYDADDLGAGARIEGPAIAEEELTTIVLLPSWTANTDERGNFLMTRNDTP